MPKQGPWLLLQPEEPQSPGSLGIYWLLPDSPLHPCVPVSHRLVFLCAASSGSPGTECPRAFTGDQEADRWWQQSRAK